MSVSDVLNAWHNFPRSKSEHRQQNAVVSKPAFLAQSGNGPQHWIGVSQLYTQAPPFSQPPAHPCTSLSYTLSLSLSNYASSPFF